MRKSALAAAAVFALLAAASAASRSVRTAESHTFDEKTDAKKRYDLRVPRGGARARLRFKGVVRSGEIKVRVFDPAGTLQRDVWRTPEGAKPGRFEFEAGRAGAAADVWTVEVELREATGRYEFTWTVE